jgi:hypothetical protein
MEVVARGKKKGMTGGVCLTVREEREADQLGRRKPKRGTHFREGVISTWARRAGEGGCGLRGRLGSMGRAGPIGPDPGHNLNGKLISNFK